MEEPHRILFDWGGVIAKDAALYQEILIESKRKIEKSEFKKPEDWFTIRSAGNENYFDTIEKLFFKRCDIYDSSAEVINRLTDIGYETHIIFDNKPSLNVSENEALFLFASSLKDRGILPNGVHINPDKPNFAKIIGAEIVVDDDPRMAIAYAIRGIKSILMLRKWNRKFDLDSLILHMGERAIGIWQMINIVEDMSEVETQIYKILNKE